ncbi:MAG: hypothetical protein KME10_11495 [Plectolyngbya sp. WJT66-NPBG17]|jgi:hypothetical protein|nr:hypothetical protein [Plectolyngbya sp. WJT66-NPBG17]MBW4527249.1 hypothetical protein [Phormidium tanganyikae FI6-MK23]
MKPNYFVKRLMTGLFAVLTMASLWFSTPNANAAPIFFANANKAAQATEDASKGIVEKARDTVKDAARSNSSKVDNSTDGDSTAARKAKDDAGTIQKRADEDASRTKDAIDNNMGAVKKAVEGIKDAFGQ